MRKWKLATEIEHRARQVVPWLIQAFLFVLIVFYTIAVFVNRELGWAAGIERPLELTALLLIVAILGRIEARLPRDGAAEVTIYTDSTSFYEATRKTVESSRRRVYVTYFRSTSPHEAGSEVKRHIKACRRWANSSPKHSFRRVLINADNPSMAGYLQEELAEVLRARANERHYNVKLLPNIPHGLGVISLGIYDYDQVFISYASGSDRSVGLRIRSREVVRDCFEHYYDHLWTSATDIDKASIGQAPAANLP